MCVCGLGDWGIRGIIWIDLKWGNFCGNRVMGGMRKSKKGILLKIM